MVSISVYFSYEYFHNQAKGLGLGPGPVPGPKFKRDRDQLLSPEMSGTGSRRSLHGGRAKNSNEKNISIVANYPLILRGCPLSRGF